MPTFPLNLPTGSHQAREGQAGNTRLVNAYAEAQREGKSEYVIYAAPGLTRWDSGSYTGVARGIIELNSEALICFLGNQIVSFDSGGNGTLLTTISGSGKLHLARNRASTPQIGIVNSTGQTHMLAGGVLTQVTDTDLPIPNSICYLDGAFIWGIEDGRIYCSDVEDGTSIQGDAFGTARSDSSDLRTVFAHAGFLYVFKNEGAEIWQSDPALANENWYFSPVQQDIDIGCVASHSVAAAARGLVWVDDDGAVRFGRDGGAEKISNASIERDIASLSQSAREGLEGFSYVFHGHQMYCLTCPSWTWEYDFLHQRWQNRLTFGKTRWRVTNCEAFNGKYIVGNIDNGSLYYINPDDYDDAGESLVMQVWCSHSHRFPNRMIVDAIELDVIAGQGLITGDDADVNPKVMVDFSDDGGATFEGQRTASIGALGERRQIVRLNGWGLVSEKGRIWRISMSSAVKRGLISAALHGRPVS